MTLAARPLGWWRPAATCSTARRITAERVSPMPSPTSRSRVLICCVVKRSGTAVVIRSIYAGDSPEDQEPRLTPSPPRRGSELDVLDEPPECARPPAVLAPGRGSLAGGRPAGEPTEKDPAPARRHRVGADTVHDAARRCKQRLQIARCGLVRRDCALRSRGSARRCTLLRALGYCIV